MSQMDFLTTVSAQQRTPLSENRTHASTRATRKQPTSVIVCVCALYMKATEVRLAVSEKMKTRTLGLFVKALLQSLIHTNGCTPCHKHTHTHRGEEADEGNSEQLTRRKEEMGIFVIFRTQRFHSRQEGKMDEGKERGALERWMNMIGR